MIERGYAVRSYGRNPSTNSIAVPILDNGTIIATVGLTYFVRALDAHQVQVMAAHLRSAAYRIEESLRKHSDATVLHGQAFAAVHGPYSSH